MKKFLDIFFNVRLSENPKILRCIFFRYFSYNMHIRQIYYVELSEESVISSILIIAYRYYYDLGR